jgi:hypothetical protein
VVKVMVKRIDVASVAAVDREPAVAKALASVPAIVGTSSEQRRDENLETMPAAPTPKAPTIACAVVARPHETRAGISMSGAIISRTGMRLINKLMRRL